MDRFQLIDEIKKRPYVWRELNEQKCSVTTNALWNEIAVCFGSDATTCQYTWQQLSTFYSEQKKRRQKLKDRNIYNPDANYDIGSKWIYFKTLKFLDVNEELNTQLDLCNTKQTIVQSTEPNQQQFEINYKPNNQNCGVSTSPSTVHQNTLLKNDKLLFEDVEHKCIQNEPQNQLGNLLPEDFTIKLEESDGEPKNHLETDLNIESTLEKSNIEDAFAYTIQTSLHESCTIENLKIYDKKERNIQAPSLQNIGISNQTQPDVNISSQQHIHTVSKDFMKTAPSSQQNVLSESPIIVKTELGTETCDTDIEMQVEDMKAEEFQDFPIQNLSVKKSILPALRNVPNHPATTLSAENVCLAMEPSTSAKLLQKRNTTEPNTVHARNFAETENNINYTGKLIDPKSTKRTYEQMSLSEELKNKSETFSKYKVLNLKGSKQAVYAGDADYTFLFSCLEPMKAMSRSQNLEFRSGVTDIVLDILSSSESPS